MTRKVDRLSGRLEDGTECVLYFDDGGPRLEIDRDHQDPREVFDAPQTPERLVVHVPPNQVVTLSGVYRVRRRSNFARSFEEYRANITYVGPTEFLPTMEIQKTTFRPTNERLAVMYGAHRVHRELNDLDVRLGELLGASVHGNRYYLDIIDTDRCTAFTGHADNLSISGHVAVSINHSVQGNETTESRNVHLDYGNLTDVSVALSDLMTACNFMSLMVGTTISPTSLDFTTTGNLDRFGRSPTFDVYARWRAAGMEIDPQHGRRCLAAPLLNLEIYETAIANWMARRNDWGTSYALGTVCLAHQGTISARRFLDAAAWFESIPTTGYETQRDRIDRGVIAAAAAAAAAAFNANGVEVTEDRARALLSPVNAASLNMRLVDALALARAHLGQETFPASLDTLARSVSAIRGRFAHGEDAFASNLGHLIDDATMLLEVLSCVLTLDGLGSVILAPDNDHPWRRALAELQHFQAETDSSIGQER